MTSLELYILYYCLVDMSWMKWGCRTSLKSCISHGLCKGLTPLPLLIHNSHVNYQEVHLSWPHPNMIYPFSKEIHRGVTSHGNLIPM